MKLKLVRVSVVAGSLLAGMWFSLICVQQLSLAQGSGPVEMTKVLNKDDNVVRVGEALTYTVSLTNTSSFTLTQVVLVDDYDQDTLHFAGATEPYILYSGDGTFIWPNAVMPPLYPNPGLPPGECVEFTAVFTAFRPHPAIVNRVRAQDLMNESSQLTETAEISHTLEVLPNQVPVFKAISLPPGGVPQVGFPVTFTHWITNDGASILVQLPLTDTYDTRFLEFDRAVPMPTTIITGPTMGTLVWDNLVDYFGPINPFATVVVTTVFTATARVDNTLNRAEVAGAMDEYGNIWAPWSAEVPITIINVPIHYCLPLVITHYQAP